jgi:putative flippase GtrA
VASAIFNQKERIRFFRFAVVGVIGAVIDFGMMNLLTQKANMSLVLAGTISFISAIVSNFIWNRYWTYPESRSRSIAKQLTMFFAVNIAGMVIRLPILHFAEPPMLNFFSELNLNLLVDAEFLAKNFTLALAVGIVMLWNFFVNRYWTYNDVDAPVSA